RKLSTPGFETSSASMMLPPKPPTLYMSRTPPFWMMKRASAFSIMMSPGWPSARGPVSSSAALVMMCALARPTHELSADELSNTSQSTVVPEAPLSARHASQRMARRAQPPSASAVVAPQRPRASSRSGCVVTLQDAVSLPPNVPIAFTIFSLPVSWAARAEVSSAAEVACGTSSPASDALIALRPSFQIALYSLPPAPTSALWHSEAASSSYGRSRHSSSTLRPKMSRMVACAPASPAPADTPSVDPKSGAALQSARISAALSFALASLALGSLVRHASAVRVCVNRPSFSSSLDCAALMHAALALVCVLPIFAACLRRLFAHSCCAADCAAAHAPDGCRAFAARTATSRTNERERPRLAVDMGNPPYPAVLAVLMIRLVYGLSPGHGRGEVAGNALLAGLPKLRQCTAERADDGAHAQRAAVAAVSPR